MDSNEGASTTNENPCAQLASAESSSNSHRPIHQTRSVPQFGVEERRIHALQAAELDGRRSRSHSEPLTREALKIAHELRKVSDLFNTNYEISSPTLRRGFSYRRGKSRRVTLGGSGGESLRQEVNQMMGNMDRSIFDSNPLPPEGTPV